MVQSLLEVSSTLVVPAFRNAPMGAVAACVEAFGVTPVQVGAAWCRLIPMRPFRAFAVRRLTELLA